MNLSNHIASKIEVNYEDIDNGERRCAFNCPVARAIKRSCPHLVNVQVNNNFITHQLKRGGERFHYKTNQELNEYITDFDEDLGEIYPIEIEIDLENKQVTNIKEIL